MIRHEVAYMCQHLLNLLAELDIQVQLFGATCSCICCLQYIIYFKEYWYKINLYLLCPNFIDLSAYKSKFNQLIMLLPYFTSSASFSKILRQITKINPQQLHCKNSSTTFLLLMPFEPYISCPDFTLTPCQWQIGWLDRVVNFVLSSTILDDA